MSLPLFVLCPPVAATKLVSCGLELSSRLCLSAETTINAAFYNKQCFGGPQSCKPYAGYVSRLHDKQLQGMTVGPEQGFEHKRQQNSQEMTASCIAA